MRVSVVIPVYNAGAYLEACLRSLAAQNMPDFEVLIVDDGSGDESPVIAGQFAGRDARFRLLRQDHGGVSMARNLGIRHARGDFLFMLDADDLLPTDAFSALLAAAGQADIVCARHEEFDPDGTRRSFAPEVWPRPPSRVIPRILRGDSVYNITCNKLYNRAFWQDAQLRYTAGLKIGEDALVNLRAFASATSVGYVPRVTYAYRMHPSSAMHGAEGDFDRHLPLFRAMLGELRALGLERRYLAALVAAMALRYRRQYGAGGLLRGFQAVLAGHVLSGAPKSPFVCVLKSRLYPLYYACSFPLRRLWWKLQSLREI